MSVTTNGQTKVITNNQSATVTLNDGGDSPVDVPVVDNPPENMQSLIDLTTPAGTDGLYLTQPDLSAAEDNPSADNSPDVPTDTPDANVVSGRIPTMEMTSEGPTAQSTVNDSIATPDGGSFNSSQQQSPTGQPPPTDPPPPNDPGSNPPPSDPGTN